MKPKKTGENKMQEKMQKISLFYFVISGDFFKKHDIGDEIKNFEQI